MKRNGELETKDIRIGDLERKEWRKSYETLSVSAKSSSEGKSVALGNEGLYYLKKYAARYFLTEQQYYEWR